MVQPLEKKIYQFLKNETALTRVTPLVGASSCKSKGHDFDFGQGTW